jgi:hypothetical protein
MPNLLCKYRDSLGEPGVGMHKHVLGLAIADIIATILLCLVIWNITKINPIIIGVSVAILTIIVHRLFCVNTTVNKLIFGTV